MIIRREYICETRGYAALQTWLADKLVPDYADAVVLDEENGTSFGIIKDGHTIATYADSTSGGSVWSLYNTDKFTSNPSYSCSATNNECSIYGYVTKNAVVLHYVRPSNTSTTEKNHAPIIFTKDNLDNTTIVSANLLIPSNSSWTHLNCLATAHVIRWDEQISTTREVFNVPNNPNTFTLLVPFPVHTLDGSIVYTPNVFFCPSYQHSNVCTLTINGESYLSFGMWAIKDE